MKILLESINQRISEGIFRSNATGMVYVNRAFAEIFGYENEKEALSTIPSQVYKNANRREELIKLLKENKTYENEESVFIRKDGSEFIGLESTIQHKDENGELFWDGAIRDITKERNNQQRIKDNEQLIRSINRNINQALFRSTYDGGLIYVNDEFANMFGYESVKEVIETKSLNLYKDHKYQKKLREELLENESLSNKEVEFRRENGSSFWGYLSSIKVNGDKGEIYFDGAIRDISHQKQIENASKRRGEMQQLLIDISSKFINLPLEKFKESISETLQQLGKFVDADRVYIFEYSDNGEKCSHAYGWNAEEIKPVKEGSKNIPVQGQLKELLGKHFKGEHLYIPDIQLMGNGEQKEAFLEQEIKSLLSVPLMYDNKCRGFIGFDSVRNHGAYSNDEIVLLKLFADMLINVDIRTQDHNKLRKLVETTAEQNGRLKDFSYIISHNFRSSVANIEGLVGVLKSDPTNAEYMKMLESTTYKLTEAIRNINELLNFEKGVTDMDRQQTNVCKIINSVIELNNKVIKEKRIEIDIDIPSSLELNTIPVYLESIFHNLITNAIKYGTTETQKKISITSRVHKKFVSLKVQDFGLGIDLKKHQDRVFKLGSRFHTSETDGHGMGLFMTKHQVEAMGGKIDVQSEVNKGTTFIVIFYG
ncbi:MAG: PAS domain S-box protein [Ekhidna sp.]